MAANVFWNLVFLFDFGGVIALMLYALARWPVLIKRLDQLIYLALCIIPLVLIGGVVITWCFSSRRGVIIHGIHYEDIWRDD